MSVVDFINGKTDKYMLFGKPIGHTFSPFIHNTVALELGINMVYTAACVEDLRVAVEGAYSMGIKGINITIPYKEEVIKYLYKIDNTARLIGAVNTLKYTENGYIGYNTDILGLSKTIEINGININGSVVVVLGAGGASKAAVATAINSGARKIYIINRTIDNAIRLREGFVDKFKGDIVCGGFDLLDNINEDIILIQTTSVGMGEGVDISPLSNNNILKHTIFLVDVIYNPLETRLMREARKLGILATNGFDMLIYQGLAAFEIWNELEIPNEKKLDLRNELREYFKG